MNGQAKMPVDQMLADSLKELALIRPMEKITIKEITDKAGVIRPTFYNHFQDKYELIEWIINTELLLPIVPLIKARMIGEAMVLLFTNLEKEKTFYQNAVKMEGVVKFHDIAMKCVKAMLWDIFEERSSGKKPKHVWLTSEVLSTYYAQSMCYAAEEWVKMGMTLTPQEMAEAYQYILSKNLEEILDEL